MESIRMVIAEDDPMVMEVNSEFVSRIDGFKVVGKAFTAIETFQVINSSKPHLLLLDFFLPDRNGLSILKEIRELNLPVDVILVTANRSPEHIQQIMRYGAVDYIFKPFRFERIQSALIQYALIHRKLRELQELEQSDLDIIMRVRNHKEGHQPSLLPKGLNERTLQQILQYLADQKDSLSAEDVAAGTGLARVTVRRYLDYLAKRGHIHMEIQYGSIGRPINRYKI